MIDKYKRALNTLTYLSMMKSVRTIFKYNKKHNDIKLSNFLLVEKDDDAEVYLTDFGFMDDRKGGTPLFASPECYIGTQVGKSDIYSLAGCFISLLSNSSTFAKLILLPLMTEKQKELANLIISKNAIVKLAVEMLNPNPSKRPSIDSIIDRLAAMPIELFEIDLSKDNDVKKLLRTFKNDKSCKSIQKHLQSIRLDCKMRIMTLLIFKGLQFSKLWTKNNKSRRPWYS